MEVSGTEAEIPIPMSSACVGGHGHSTIQHQHPTNGSPPSRSADTQEDHHRNHIASPCNAKKRVVVKYRECLKNHAAAIGGNATDGCGEFMPSGEEGTLEALKCSACSCHRNFHRREAEGDPSWDHFLHPLRGRKLIGYGPASNGLIPRAVMPLGAMQSSESDDIEGGATAARHLHHHLQLPMAIKKRFRTKFTPEQKEKMLGFAEKVGWRLQKQEEGLVQQFCQEIGVKRRVLKVWMHNNKLNLSKRMSPQLQCH